MMRLIKAHLIIINNLIIMCSEEIDEMIKYTSHVHNVFNTLTEN